MGMENELMPLKMVCGEEIDEPRENGVILACDGCRMRCTLAMHGHISQEEAEQMPCILNDGCLDVDWRLVE